MGSMLGGSVVTSLSSTTVPGLGQALNECVLNEHHPWVEHMGLWGVLTPQAQAKEKMIKIIKICMYLILTYAMY